jgi:6,7-dimethyl-8-ribityllumazine synthase
MTVQSIEGQLTAVKDARFAIVAARFNEFIVDRLVDGAVDALRRHGVAESRILVVRVPGAFEIPVACHRLASSGKVSAIIALGCVIRGATAHFEYVSSAATSGCSQVASATGVPVIFGVLTTDSGHRTGGHQGRQQGRRVGGGCARNGEPDARAGRSRLRASLIDCRRREHFRRACASKTAMMARAFCAGRRAMAAG